MADDQNPPKPPSLQALADSLAGSLAHLDMHQHHDEDVVWVPADYDADEIQQLSEEDQALYVSDLHNFWENAYEDFLDAAEIAIEEEKKTAADSIVSQDVLDALSSLSDATKIESVEIAKEILRKLRIEFGEVNILDGLMQKASDCFLFFMQMNDAVVAYLYRLMKLRAEDQDILKNDIIFQANQSIAKMATMMRQETLKLVKEQGKSDRTETLKQQINDLPRTWREPVEKTVGQLIDKVEKGLNVVLQRANVLYAQRPTEESWQGVTRFQHTAEHKQQKEENQSQKTSIKVGMDDDYVRQQQARQQARQQQMLANMQQQVQQASPLQRDSRVNAAQPAQTPNQGAARTPQQQQRQTQQMQATRTAPNMQNLLNAQQMAQIRSVMAAPKDTPAVQPNNTQEIIKQQIMQRERQQREQRQRQRQKQAQDAAELKAIETAQQVRQMEQQQRQEVSKLKQSVARDMRKADAAKQKAAEDAKLQLQAQQVPPTQQKITPPDLPNKKDPSKDRGRGF